MTRTVEMYTLQVVGPGDPDDPPQEEDRRLLANLPAMLASLEEDLSDLLPEGWTAKISPWWAEEGETNG